MESASVELDQSWIALQVVLGKAAALQSMGVQSQGEQSCTGSPLAEHRSDRLPAAVFALVAAAVVFLASQSAGLDDGAVHNS